MTAGRKEDGGLKYTEDGKREGTRLEVIRHSETGRKQN